MELAINGRQYQISDGQADRLLVWVLRDELGLIGTKFGCGIGICGSCTVLIDGKPARSCLTAAGSVDDKQITTIEGLASDSVSDLHPVQQAFLETQTPQCSWCMSGQMLTAASFLAQNPDPTEEDIVSAMNSVYCRCGTYVRIKQAVIRAAEIMAQGEQE